jgi:Fic family protein
MSFLSKLRFWTKKEAEATNTAGNKLPEKPLIETFKDVERERNRLVYEKLLGKLDKLDKLDELGEINLKLDSLSQLDTINSKLDLLGVLDKKLTELGELGKPPPNLPNIEEKITEIKLTMALQKVLELVKQRGNITTSELAELRGVSTATASEQLGELVKLGLLAKLDQGEYKYLEDGEVLSY